MLPKPFNGTLRHVQFGIVSAGDPRCAWLRESEKSKPGIYVNVKQYMDWILDTIEE